MQVPNRALALTQTSLGSGVELELHTEQCFSRIRPDILSLACLRGHPGARTFSLPAHALLAHLTPAERAMLREPLWMTGVDGSFRLDGNHTFLEGDVRGPLAIISGPHDDPSVLFDQVIIPRPFFLLSCGSFRRLKAADKAPPPTAVRLCSCSTRRLVCSMTSSLPVRLHRT